MTVNFTIEKNYALLFENRLLDLHNNFNLVSIEYDTVKGELKMTWHKSDGEWVPGNEEEKIELIHKSVSHLFIGEKDERGRMQDDISLDDLTFYPSTHRNEFDNIIDQATPSVNDDILYTLQSGRKIQLCCAEIELVLS